VRGSTIVLALTNVKDSSGLAITLDPSTVTVKVTDPTPTTTDYTLGAGQVVKDSVGNYHYNLATTGASALGYWVYTWITTGTPAHAEKNVFLLESEVSRP
jgi:hypothetical protein